MAEFRKKLENTDWNLGINTFIRKFNKVHDNSFKKKQIKIDLNKSGKRYWLSKGVKVSSKVKRILCLIDKTRCDKSILKYRENYMRVFRKVVRCAKQLDTRKKIDQAPQSSKAMWKIVNSRRNSNKKQSIDIIILKQDNKLYDSPIDVANILSDQFDNKITLKYSDHNLAKIYLTENTARINDNMMFDQIKLGTHVHSCMFGTFLCNTGLERIECRAHDLTPHVWHLLRAPAYRNHLYSPHQLDQQAIWPEYSVRTMCVWSGMFCESPRDEPRTEHRPDLPPQQLHTAQPHNDGALNLRKNFDTMKLSMVVGGECENKRECRAALTDSCVDELPVLPVPADAGPDTVDGLHPDHFENSTRLPRDIASGSSSLERELGGAADLSDKIIPDQVIDHTEDLTTSDNSQVNGTAESVSDVAASVASPDVDTPEEPPVFVCDTYSDVIGMAEAARESARTRNISITWRSVSESSNQSSTGFEINEARAEPPASRNTSHDSSPMDNHTTEDRTNHNVVTEDHTTENGEERHQAALVQRVRARHTHSHGGLHTHIHAPVWPVSSLYVQHHHAELLVATAPDELVIPVESRHRVSQAAARRYVGAACAAARWAARACAACAAPPRPPAAAPAAHRADPVDGLPPALDPLQARLHQIILYQKKVVEELSGQLREAREALRLSSPPAPAPPPAPPAATPTQKTSSGSGSVRGSGSSSGSASEVEVGEEARGVVWLPDSAVPRCQYCRNHFWLARRRHHCRRCGGIFCGSCSEMSSWGDCGSMRVCRRCRALR
ncbi:hypothetical protein HF086_013298 [Spodoptera exigua]|uniref:phosphatidylinositol-3,5-bisphosphate 3-phosphatase n=1 Tax=Spodoptera exigua TaxID=7107 RepID=A0A922MRQ0_SPOEX|nr:hypothetical protein HF086_013298 [Spodoptera exigua]